MIFSTWLFQQQDRNDPTGDLARDYQNDPRRPKGRRLNVEQFSFYLSTRHPSLEARQAFDDAAKEYERVADAPQPSSSR